MPTADHRAFTAEASDASRFPSYEAYPATPSRQGVVILPDVRGSHDYYRALAVRFAEAGLAAVVLDYYGRHTDEPGRGEDFDWQPLLPQVRSEHVEQDCAALVDRLRSTGVESIHSVGFCFGGSQSWRLSASDLDLSGAIGFYGQPQLVQDVVPRMRAPLLLLVAGADVATSPEESEQFATELRAAAVVHEQVVFNQAPHSFFDRAAPEWAAACDEAWRQMLGFIGSHTRHPA